MNNFWSRLDITRQDIHDQHEQHAGPDGSAPSENALTFLPMYYIFFMLVLIENKLFSTKSMTCPHQEIKTCKWFNSIYTESIPIRFTKTLKLNNNLSLTDLLGNKYKTKINQTWPVRYHLCFTFTERRGSGRGTMGSDHPVSWQRVREAVCYANRTWQLWKNVIIFANRLSINQPDIHFHSDYAITFLP